MNMSEYAYICVNMAKSAWMAFTLYFPIVIPLPTWTRAYLFQHLHKTRSFSLKENNAVLLETQTLIFL